MSYQQNKLRYSFISGLPDGKSCFFWMAWKLRDPFCLRLTDRVEAGFLVSAMGTVLFFHVITRGLFQFQAKLLALFMKVNTG